MTDLKEPATKRWYLRPATFLEFKDMKQAFEKRKRLQNELSQDEFVALFVRHRTEVLDVLLNAELAPQIAGKVTAEASAQ